MKGTRQYKRFAFTQDDPPVEVGDLSVHPTTGRARVFRGGSSRNVVDAGDAGVAGGFAPLNGSGFVDRSFLGTGATGGGSRFLADDYTWKVGGGGGGTTDHASLDTGSLVWNVSAHTGTASRFAIFNSSGDAAYLAFPSTGVTVWTGSVFSAATISSPLLYSGTTLSIQQSDSSHAGYLSSADWTTFNAKVPPSRSVSTTAPLAGGGSLSSDLTLTLDGWSGTTDGQILYRNGSVVATLTVDAPLSWSGGVLGVLDFVGDTGAGGESGAVPAPAAGDGAALKYLCADGTWKTMPTGAVTFYPDPSVSSDISGYKVALTTPSTATETSLTDAATGTGDNLLASFATATGVPGVTTIPHGTYSFHFHVETGNINQIGRLKVEIYSCSSTGTSETLHSSGYSDSFSDGSQELNINLTDPSGYAISATDRLVFKVYAARVSGPTTCDITVYFNGVTRNPSILTTIGAVSPSVIGAQPASAELTGLAALGDGLPVRSTTWQLATFTGMSLTGTALAVLWGTSSTTSCRGDDARLSDKRTANAIYETGGPTTLAVGAIANGELLQRSGSTIIGAAIGAVVQAYSAILAGIVALSATTGLVAKIGASTFITRTLQAGAGATITNGDGISGNPTISVSGSSGGPGSASAVTLYGSARDGDVTFSGGAVTGWSLAGSVYTRTLARDPHYKTLTIATGYSLITAGTRIRCRTLVMGDNCSITAPGGNASLNTAGTGSAPATIATASAGACFYGSAAGAAGRTGNAVGLNGGAIPAGAFRAGGAGGTGTTSGGRVRLTSGSAIGASGNAGGGTDASASTSWHYYGDPFDIVALTGVFRNGTGIAQIAGGGSGGGGAASFLTGTGSSGGSGTGGGVCVVFAGTASFGTGCSIGCPGGSGGNAGTGSTDSVLAGGHGGGGGLLVCVIGEMTGSNLPSFNANGGPGGNASRSGTGYWAEGGNGGDGGNLFVYVGTNSVGGTPTCTATGGTKGADAGSGTGFIGASNGATGANIYYNEGT